jgi:hypothetical protein
MKIGIMQPYFFPYIGYFQLISSVDKFILYDNIKYTKKGWVNRNRFLQKGKDKVFSLPLKNESDYRNINERELAATFKYEKLLSQFQNAYRNAPHFSETFVLIEEILQYQTTNLFQFLHHSILQTCAHLGIATQILVSSKIDIAHDLRSQDKVIALCEAMGAEIYVNAIGGVELYSKDTFRERNIDLKFIRSKPFQYSQLGNEFIPWLSIIDVMMFNSLDAIKTCISKNYELN